MAVDDSCRFKKTSYLDSKGNIHSPYWHGKITPRLREWGNLTFDFDDFIRINFSNFIILNEYLLFYNFLIMRILYLNQ